MIIMPLKIIEHEARLTKIIVETPETKTFRFTIPEGLPHKPGQWIMLSKDLNGEPVSRAYSMASPPTEEGFVELTIKQMEKGVFSTYMCTRAKEGDVFKIKGPYGKFVFDEGAKDVMFIAAGSGIVPLMCMMRYIHDKKLPTKVTLLYSSKTEEYIIYRKELEEFANSCMRVVHTITRDPDYPGHKGRINKDMIKEVAHGMEKTFFLCGPPKMVEAVVEELQELGVPNNRIKMEKFH